MPAPEPLTVLQYVGADTDDGGILSAVRALSATDRYASVLGVNEEFTQVREPALPMLRLPPTAGERIDVAGLWRARPIARRVREWLRADARRVFHGHSRAGLLIAHWLLIGGENRVVASVHCYGRRRWFYRWSKRRLGARLYWLTPAMKAYYRCGAPTWAGCIPNCLPGAPVPPRQRGVRPGGLALGGAGLLVRWKRWEDVLEAMARLAPELRARLTFTHIGGPAVDDDSRHYAAELRERTLKLGLGEQVRWAGWQPSSADLLRQVDAVVVPSRLEPFSMVALEALFAGVPVIAANEGGPSDLVEHGRNGWLYAGGRTEALAETLREIVDTRALERVQIDGLARFSTVEVAAQWRSVYARVSPLRQGGDAV